ncbi:SPASM domain-containing protein, partial [Planomonospora parontospora]
KAAIGPTGEVWPCVLSRWMMMGNVKEQPLPEIVNSDAWKAALATIPAPRRGRGCNPDSDGNDCSPAETALDTVSLARYDGHAPNEERAFAYARGRGCNPDNDGNDCSPAETDADY